MADHFLGSLCNVVTVTVRTSTFNDRKIVSTKEKSSFSMCTTANEIDLSQNLLHL